MDAVEIQQSRFDDSLTLNAGVLDSLVDTLCWDKPQTGVIRAVDCTALTRLGELKSGQELWISPQEDGYSDLVDQTRDYLLPFMASMHSESAMKCFLKEQLPALDAAGRLYLVILEELLGNGKQAATQLDDLLTRYPGWFDRAHLAIRALMRHRGYGT